MTNDEKISKWIDEQLAAGKTPDHLHNQMFVSKRGNESAVYTLKKSGNKGKFKLEIYVGAKNLDTLEEK